MVIASKGVKLIFSLILISVLISNNFCFSQDKNESGNDEFKNQTDIKDVLRGIFKTKPKKLDSITTVDLSKNVSVSILPGVSYNPATNVVFGVSSSISWIMGNQKTTTNSVINSGVSYSTKNQLKISLQSNINTANDLYSIQSDWRFWKYVQYTYGLGTGTEKSSEENMEFKLVRLNQFFLRKFAKNFYAGLGYSLDYYFDINTIDSSDNFLYPNINNEYSTLHGFDSTKYLSSGFVLNIYINTRDNLVNPYKGLMFDAKYYNYNKFLGSTSNWQKFDVEFRGYKSLNKKNTYIMALWLMGNIIVNGNVPYMLLPSNGWDKYNCLGRGYVQGRFRGNNLLYAEFENRIALSKNGLFGIAIFGNAITISDKDKEVKLFDYIQPAVGIGLRIKFDKYARTNIAVDYAKGKNSSGVFLNIGEFF